MVNEGLPGGVITIVFPLSGNGRGRTNKESEALGKILFAKLQQDAQHFELLRMAETQARARQEENEKFFQKHHHYPRR